MKKLKIKNYFPGGNTSQGFYSFYQYIPFHCDRVYIIKGGPGTGKSTTMKNIGKAALKKGYEIEYHWCSSDNDSIDGVVIPAKKVAIFDGTAPHMIDPENPGAVEDIINVGEFWDSKLLINNRNHIINLNQSIADKFDKTYSYLKVAKNLHQEWEKYYQKGFNQDQANLTEKNLIEKILPKNSNLTNSGFRRHLFGSAITPEGQVNYFDNLTSNMKKRYLIKGKPEIKKSKMIHKIGKTVLHHGYNVIFLHCAFNPDQIDAIIIPQLKLAVIDDSEPHQVKETKQDEVIDIMNTVNSNIISEYSANIKETKINFKNFMDKAINSLHQAKEIHDKLEQFYIKAMDFDRLETEEKKLIEKILNR